MRARKDYLALARSRKPGKKKIRKAIGQQLHYLRRNLNSIKEMIAKGRHLTDKQQLRLESITKTMYDTHSHKVSERIVSLSQFWLRSIV